MLPFKAIKNYIHKIQTDFPLSPKLLSGYQANWSKIVTPPMPRSPAKSGLSATPGCNQKPPPGADPLGGVTWRAEGPCPHPQLGQGSLTQGEMQAARVTPKSVPSIMPGTWLQLEVAKPIFCLPQS